MTWQTGSVPPLSSCVNIAVRNVLADSNRNRTGPERDLVGARYFLLRPLAEAAVSAIVVLVRIGQNPANSNTAVVSKTWHADCCTTVTNRPLRPREGRFVRVVRQLACEVFARTAVHVSPLQYLSPTIRSPSACRWRLTPFLAS